MTAPIHGSLTSEHDAAPSAGNDPGAERAAPAPAPPGPAEATTVWPLGKNSALGEREARLHEVLDASTDGFWERDVVNGRVFHSARLNELIGLPAVDTVMESGAWLARVHPDEYNNLRALYDAVLAGRQDRFDTSYRVRCADGSWRWVRARGKAVARDEAGRPQRLLGTVSDIHAQKTAEEALKVSERRLELAASAGKVGLWETDLRTGAPWRTERHAEIFGDENAAVRWEYARFLEHVTDEARPWVRELLERAAEREHFHFECPIRTVQGVQRWIEIEGTVTRDEAGVPVRRSGTIRDVTERRTMQERLAITERLAALGTLAAGLAHELNNPLSADVVGQALAIEELEALRARLRGDGPIDRADLAARLETALVTLQDSQAAGRRIARVVADLVLLGRPNPRRTRVRLREVVEQALRELPDTSARQVAVRLAAGAEPVVLGSSDQLRQVVIKLADNALKSAPAGGTATVLITLGLGAPRMALLEVSDDGAGIAPEAMKWIFDPFYTSRDVGEGMGMGLPVAHAIVTAHGGTLTARSTVGAGSTFRVELPLADAAD